MPDLDLQHRIDAVHASGRPWIIGKAAMSLNGKMTRPAGEGQWISGAASRSDVQDLRSQCDAILIGAETARMDNPSLTVRDIKVEEQPWRIVITRSGNLPNDLHLFSDLYQDRTIVMKSLSWEEIWQQLFEKGIRTVLVEGGGTVLDQLAEQNRIDESIIYYAPFNLEGNELVTAEKFRALKLGDLDTTTLEDDVRISGLVLNEP